MEKTIKLGKYLWFTLYVTLLVSGFKGFMNIYTGKFELEPLIHSFIGDCIFMFILTCVLTYIFRYHLFLHNPNKFLSAVNIVIVSVALVGYQYFINQVETKFILEIFVSSLLLGYLIATSNVIREQNDNLEE